MKTAHYRAKKDKSCRLFSVVVVMVTAAAVLVAVHYGSKQCDIETLNCKLSHELGSERSERVSDLNERSGACERSEQCEASE